MYNPIYPKHWVVQCPMIINQFNESGTSLNFTVLMTDLKIQTSSRGEFLWLHNG